MQINTHYNQTPFKSSFLADLTKVIPNTRACKNLTTLDVNCFRAYAYAMRYRMKNSAEEIKNLFKLEGDDFINETFNYIGNKLGIDKELMPEVLVLDEDDPDAPMAYRVTESIFLRNKDLSMYTKPQIFGFIRHEIQHYKQIIDIIRHETLGEQLIDIRTENHLTNLQNGFERLLQSNMSVEELSNIEGIDEWTLQMYEYLQDEIKEKGSVNLKEELEYLREDTKNTLREQRDLIIDKMGVIKEGTKEAKNTEIFFKELLNINFYNSDRKIDLGLYISSALESDATLAGQMAEFEIRNGGCFFKQLKDSALYLFNNASKEEIESIERAAKNQTNKT